MNACRSCTCGPWTQPQHSPDIPSLLQWLLLITIFLFIAIRHVTELYKKINKVSHSSFPRAIFKCFICILDFAQNMFSLLFLHFSFYSHTFMLTNSVHTCSNFIHPSTHTQAPISSTHTHTRTHRLQSHTHIHRLPSHPSTCTQTHTLISSIHKCAQNGLTATRAWCSWLGRCPHVPQSCPPTSRPPWVCVSTLQSHHLKQYLTLLTLTPHSAHLKQHLTLLTLSNIWHCSP